MIIFSIVNDYTLIKRIRIYRSEYHIKGLIECRYLSTFPIELTAKIVVAQVVKLLIEYLHYFDYSALYFSELLLVYYLFLLGLQNIGPSLI
jgi:hypothetical protein